MEVKAGLEPKANGKTVFSEQETAAYWRSEFERSWERLAARAKEAGITEDDVYREVELHRSGR